MLRLNCIIILFNTGSFNPFMHCINMLSEITPLRKFFFTSVTLEVFPPLMNCCNMSPQMMMQIKMFTTRKALIISFRQLSCTMIIINVRLQSFFIRKCFSTGKAFSFMSNVNVLFQSFFMSPTFGEGPKPEQARSPTFGEGLENPSIFTAVHTRILRPVKARGPAFMEGLKPGPGPSPTFKARARPDPSLSRSSLA